MIGTVEWFALSWPPAMKESPTLLGFPGTFRLNATVPLALPRGMTRVDAA